MRVEISRAFSNGHGYTDKISVTFDIENMQIC